MMLKERPTITPETAEFWAGCARHELLLQQCEACGACQFYPRLMCSNCSGRSLRWLPASGLGRIRSYTIVHRAVSEAYQADVPYVVALVVLEEGPSMMSNIVDCRPDEVSVDSDVMVRFVDWGDGLVMPMFALS